MNPGGPPKKGCSHQVIQFVTLTFQGWSWWPPLLGWSSLGDQLEEGEAKVPWFLQHQTCPFLMGDVWCPKVFFGASQPLLCATKTHRLRNPGVPGMGVSKKTFFCFTRGGSIFWKWPFYPLFGGHDSPLKGSQKTITKRAQSQNCQYDTFFKPLYHDFWGPTFFGLGAQAPSLNTPVIVANASCTAATKNMGSFSVCREDIALDVFFLGRAKCTLDLPAFWVV